MLSGLLSISGSGYCSVVGSVPLSITDVVAAKCAVSGNLAFTVEAPVGEPAAQSKHLDVQCSAVATIRLSVTWTDGGAMASGSYVFHDNGDTAAVDICSELSQTRCWPSPADVASSVLPVSVRLTYTASVAGSRQRVGTLHISYT